MVGKHTTVSSSSLVRDITIERHSIQYKNQGNSRDAVEVLDYLENYGYAMDLSGLFFKFSKTML